MSGGVEGVALLPCPFCGSPEVYPQDGDAWQRDTGTRFQFIWCIRCNTKGAEHPTEAEAIAAWNTRTAPPARTYAEGVQKAVAGVLLGEMFMDPDARWELAGKIAAAIRLLSQEGGEARSEGWTDKGREWLDSGAPLATSRSQHEGAE